MEAPANSLERALVATIAALAFGLALAAPAAAHPGHPHATEVTPRVAAVAGDSAVAVDQGMYRVAPALGAPVLTHGPDTRAALTTRASELAADGTGFVEGALERPPACANDFYLRVVYVNPSGSPNRLGEQTARIRSVVGRMNAALNSESIASGGPGADFKLLCDSSGQVQIDQLTVPDTTFEGVVAAARAAGLSSDRANLLLFVDGELGGSCGISTYEDDPRLTVDNRSNSGGGFALVYEPCWDTETAMHESAHLMGAVQGPAPHSTGSGGHCNEGADVMCYAPDGGDRNQQGMVEACPGALRFDCNFDDYFDSAPEPGEYLESHWNVGSRLNRFIAFDGATVAAPARTKRVRIKRRGRGATGVPGEWRRFEVRVPRSASALRVRLFAGKGSDLALFVRRSSDPTRSVFSCRDTLKNGHATCLIEEPAPGRWHAGVLTRGGAVGVGFKLGAKAKPAQTRP